MKASLSANDETVPTIPSSPQHLVGQDGAGNPVTTLDHQRVVPMSPPLPATLHGQRFIVVTSHRIYEDKS